MSSDGKSEVMAPAGSREQNKGGRGRITAFYMETLILAVIFVMVILVLIRMFSMSVRMSTQANDLTCAVRLAENAAEAVASSDSAQELALLLDENGNVRVLEDGHILVEYDREMKPVSGGDFRMEITWEPRADGCVSSVITVSRVGDQQPIYTLTTAVYAEEAVP